eukprot:TRINITY_DN13275_c0_g1_i1.p1 TRINITY_DN13275_c0_g1~~TRINITY_DN13275_c0_g1_i1.p1  ORF type:complete len:321 (+),score=116.92 TRINITY_DN13275_c0_g1_i1:103-963(+)
MAAAGADSQQSPQPTVAELRAQLEEANAARRAAEAALKSEREQREAEAARHRDEEASLRGDNQRLHARLLAAVRAQLTPQPELKLLMAEDDEGRERQQMVQQEKQERGAMREGNVEVRKAPYRQGRGLRVSAMFTLSEVAYRVATYHPRWWAPVSSGTAGFVAAVHSVWHRAASLTYRKSDSLVMPEGEMTFTERRRLVRDMKAEFLEFAESFRGAAKRFGDQQLLGCIDGHLTEAGAALVDLHSRVVSLDAEMQTMMKRAKQTASAMQDVLCLRYGRVDCDSDSY